MRWLAVILFLLTSLGAHTQTFKVVESAYAYGHEGGQLIEEPPPHMYITFSDVAVIISCSVDEDKNEVFAVSQVKNTDKGKEYKAVRQNEEYFKNVTITVSWIDRTCSILNHDRADMVDDHTFVPLK